MLRKIALFAVLIGTALALAAFLYLRYRSSTEPEPFPPGALAGYLPADSTVVLTLNVRPLLDAPVLRTRLGPALKNLLRRGAAGQPWFQLAGIDPFADIDQIQVSFAAGDPEHPLWLVRGRFFPARFQVGPDKLRPRVEKGRRIYEYTDLDFGPILLALVGDTLVVSALSCRLDDALACAAGPRPVGFRYPALAALLKRVDQKQAVWLAASLQDFGAAGSLKDWALSLVLRPVLARAQAISGGVAVAEDLRAEFAFRARDQESARQLEEDLKRAVEVAKEGAPLFVRDKDLLLFFQLLGTGVVGRDGAAVTLRCRLTAEQLSP
jgi:hypothetical protein